MRTWTRAASAAIGALALTVALVGCNDPDADAGSGGAESRESAGSTGSPSADSSSDSGAEASDGKETFRLGEESPEQESDMKEYDGATFTVTPMKVRNGTAADLANSGLKRDKDDEPQIPIYVWSTLTHKSGKAMQLGHMDNDLVMRTDKGHRTRPLIVLMGSAKWPDCPATDTTKKVEAGQSEKVCTAFLVPEGHKAEAVELTRGFTKKPLEWPVND